MTARILGLINRIANYRAKPSLNYEALLNRSSIQTQGDLCEFVHCIAQQQDPGIVQFAVWPEKRSALMRREPAASATGCRGSLHRASY
jgi:hypothetical protein